MGPKARYAALIKQGVLQEDTRQKHVLACFESSFQAIESTARSSWWSFLLPRRCKLFAKHLSPIYLWGSVGTGKTVLMDLFYHSLSTSRKRRMHFHPFMHWVHQRMQEMVGVKDPLKQIAREYAQLTDVLCFDEFYVADITNATLLAGLLKALMDQGVFVIITSNIEPRKLYSGGLQRQRFMPTIDLIEQTFTVLDLDHAEDYRKNQPKQVQRYVSPLGNSAKVFLTKTWNLHTHDAPIKPCVVSIHKRKIKVQAKARNAVWFDFQSLCVGPVGSQDYWELATRYPTFFLSGVPQLSDKRMDELWRFIQLVDILHEHGVRWFISAQVPLEKLYAGHKIKHRFVRTLSRLSVARK
jgi:cell division protein ZapE